MKVSTKLFGIFILFCLFALSCENKTANDGSEDPISPVINLLLPNTGISGEKMTITGKNFGENKDVILVKFNGQIVPIASFTASEITLFIPDIQGKVDVTVTVHGQESKSLPFTYRPATVDPAKADKDKITDILKRGASIVWVFAGNSITQGAKHTHGLRSYQEIFSERIRWELNRTQDYIVNSAVSGNTSKDILDDFQWRIGQFKPIVVSVMVGTNDAALGHNISIAQFKDNLTQLILKIRNLGAIPILLSPNIIIVSKAQERSRLNQYVTVVREVTERDKVIFVDNWSNWNNEMHLKYNNQVNKFLLNDPLHPNGMGHKEIAIAMFKELSIFNANDPTCGGEYYEGEH